MISPVEVFTQGGVFQFAVLPAAILTLVVAFVLPIVIGLAKWRVPASLTFIALLGPLAVGLAGTMLGMNQAWQALAVASPDYRDFMLAAGASVALYPMLLAVWLVIPAAVAACFAGAVGAVAAVGPAPRVDVRGLMGAIGGAVGALVVSVGVLVAVLGLEGLRESLMWVATGLALCAVVTGFSVAACSRIAAEDALHQGRIAGSRFFVAFAGAFALVLLGEALRMAGMCMAGAAAAGASDEVRPVMLAYAQQYATHGAWIGWLLALVPLTAGTVGSLHWVRRVDGRVGAGAAIAIGSVVALLVMLYVGRAMTVHHISGLS